MQVKSQKQIFYRTINNSSHYNTQSELISQSHDLPHEVVGVHKLSSLAFYVLEIFLILLKLFELRSKIEHVSMREK